MSIKNRVGFLNAALNVNNRQGKFGDYSKLIAMGLTSEELDWPNLDQPEADYAIACGYEMERLKLAETAGVKFRLLGLICDPMWANSYSKNHARRIDQIIDAHSVAGIEITLMVNREPDGKPTPPPDYANLYRRTHRIIQWLCPKTPLALGCLAYAQSGRLQWLNDVLDFLPSNVIPDVLPINFHGDEMKPWIIPSVYASVQKVFGEHGLEPPRIGIAEAFSYGAANTDRSTWPNAQTDFQQADGYLKYIVHAELLDLAWLFFAPGLQDGTMGPGAWDGGGLIDAKGKEKIGYDMVKKFIREI